MHRFLLEAAFRLEHREPLGEPEVDLVEVACACVGVLEHPHAVEQHAVLRTDGDGFPGHDPADRPPLSLGASARSSRDRLGGLQQQRRDLARLATFHRGVLEGTVCRQPVGDSSKFTARASNSGPSTQSVAVSPPIVTRQPPHIPVPSTMIALSDTVVLTPNGRVCSLMARIIGTGK